MRIWFFGTSAFAVPSLERLVASGRLVTSCITQPDRPQGRGQRLQSSPVAQAARRLGLPLLQPQRLNTQLFEGQSADVGVVAAYGQLIRPELLLLPPHGMVGVHPSLLPKYRGAAPIAWALLNGETATGVTIFRLVERLDAGDILLQEPVAIQPHEDAERLGQRLADVGAECLIRALAALDAGGLQPRAQDESQATYAPKLTKAQGQIAWNASAEAVARLIRATVPWPGAATAWHGRPLRLWRATLGDGSVAAAPGTVIRVDAEGLAVATGRGVLVVHELQPAGSRRMTVREFLAGHPIKVGETFGGGT